PLEAAERMILAAHEAGADAAKFQTYKSEKIASRHSPAYWDTTKETSASQYDLFKKHDHFGEAEYRHLADFAREHGTTFLSTPFDLEAVDFLDIQNRLGGYHQYSAAGKNCREEKADPAGSGSLFDCRYPQRSR
ncbi:MAG: N-acetylneuraminate synthase family protein, partial [Candidatus Omnitrophica bacterium]|nr:N-acetylneuraminate synthase family protein [Candidatus Omnitrophota bacterium]